MLSEHTSTEINREAGLIRKEKTQWRNQQNDKGKATSSLARQIRAKCICIYNINIHIIIMFVGNGSFRKEDKRNILF